MKIGFRGVPETILEGPGATEDPRADPRASGLDFPRDFGIHVASKSKPKWAKFEQNDDQ